jgi:hypothetical protein
MFNSEIYCSYKWGGKGQEVIEKIESELKKNDINIIRDKTNNLYKGSLSGFIQQIGKAKAIITVISDEYLRSPYCMNELIEIYYSSYRDADFRERLFPVILEDAKIYNPGDFLEYCNYWESQKNKLEDEIKNSPGAISAIGKDYELYRKICNTMGEIGNEIRDIISLGIPNNQDNDFTVLIGAIKKMITDNIEDMIDDPSRKYRIDRISSLLESAFDDSTLVNFCLKYFMPVYNEFAIGQNRAQHIMSLITYCKNHLMMEQLLYRAEKETPEQYKRFKPYYL